MKKLPWGFHLCLDVARCCPDSIRSKANIEAFACTLVKRIDMVPFGSPQVVHFGSDNKAGFTLVQLIETSNICGHFCESDASAYIDVFSCKPYEVHTVLQTVSEFFKSQNIRMQYLERQAERAELQ